MADENIKKKLEQHKADADSFMSRFFAQYGENESQNNPIYSKGMENQGPLQGMEFGDVETMKQSTPFSNKAIIADNENQIGIAPIENNKPTPTSSEVDSQMPVYADPSDIGDMQLSLTEQPYQGGLEYGQDKTKLLQQLRQLDLQRQLAIADGKDTAQLDKKIVAVQNTIYGLGPQIKLQPVNSELINLRKKEEEIQTRLKDIETAGNQKTKKALIPIVGSGLGISGPQYYEENISEKEILQKELDDVQTQMIKADPDLRWHFEKLRSENLENINQQLAEIDSEIAKVKKDRPYGGYFVSPSYGGVQQTMSAQEYELAASRKKLEEAKLELENIDLGDVSKMKRLLNGMRQVHPLDLLPFSSFVNPFSGMLFNSAISKAEKGENLSATDKIALRALAAKQGADEWMQLTNANTSWENIGNSAVGSIPFMLEFIPFGGLTAGWETGIKGAMSLGSKAGAKKLGIYAGKAAAAELAEVPGHSMFWDTLTDNAISQYDFSFDNDGQVKVTKTGTMGLWGNIYNSWIRTFGENYSERLGNVIDELHIGKALSGTKLGKKASMPIKKLNTAWAGTRMGQTLNRWMTSPLMNNMAKYPKKFTDWNRKYIRLNNLLTEVAEERINALTEPILTGSFDWSEAYNRDRYFETVMSVALSIGATKGVQMLGAGAVRGTELASARAELSKIQDKKLRNTLVSAGQRPNMDEQLKALNQYDWGNVSASDMSHAAKYFKHKTEYDILSGIKTGIEADAKLQYLEQELPKYTDPKTGKVNVYETDNGEQYIGVFAPNASSTAGNIQDGITFVHNVRTGENVSKPIDARLVSEEEPQNYLNAEYSRYAQNKQEELIAEAIQKAVEDAQVAGTSEDEAVAATKGIDNSPLGQILQGTDMITGELSFIRVEGVNMDGSYACVPVLFDEATNTWKQIFGPNNEIIVTNYPLSEIESAIRMPDKEVNVDGDEQEQMEPSEVAINQENETIQNIQSGVIEPEVSEEQRQVEEIAIPFDEYGNAQWEQVTPNVAAQYLNNTLGVEQTKECIATAVKEAEELLIEAQGREIKSPTSQFQAYREEVEQKTRDIEFAQKEIDYWKQVGIVNSTINNLVDEEVAQEQKTPIPNESAVEDTVTEVSQDTQQQQTPSVQETEIQKNDGQLSSGGIQQLADKYSAAKKEYGHQATVMTPTGEVVKGRWVLTEAGTLTSSHNPLNGFRKSEGYPTNASGKTGNTRDYENSASNRVVTQQMAKDFRGFTDPIVNDRNSIVHSGNGRNMARQIAATNGTDTKYVQYLKDNLASYGLTEEQFAMFEHPEVSFEIENDVNEYSAEMFDIWNRDDKKAESALERAVRLSKVLTQDDVARIGSIISQYDTLDKFYSNIDSVKDVFAILMRTGKISESQVSAYIDGAKLSDSGEEFLDNVFCAAILNEDSIRILNNYKRVRRSVASAMTYIIDNYRLKKYNLQKELYKAIELLDKSGIGNEAGNTIENYMKQGDLFEGKHIEEATVQLICNCLNSKNYGDLKRLFKEYNYLADQQEGGVFEFDRKTKEELLDFVLQKLGFTEGQLTTIDNSYGRQQSNETAPSSQGAAESTTATTEAEGTGIRENSGGLGVLQGEEGRHNNIRTAAETRQEIESHIEHLSAKLNLPAITIIESAEQIEEKALREEVEKLKGKVFAWFDIRSESVIFYLPRFTGLSQENLITEVDKTIMHEVIAHKGLRSLLGQNNFDKFCDLVYSSMNGEDVITFAEYLGYDYTNLSANQRRLVADEYIASIAEGMNQENVSNEVQNAWSMIIEIFNSFLNSLGIKVTVSEADIRNALLRSYQNISKEGPRSQQNNVETETPTPLGGYTAERRFNKKSGKYIFAVNFVDRMERDEFVELKTKVKDFNGYYSSFGKGGFIFDNESDAIKFGNSVVSAKKETTSTDVVQTQKTPVQETPVQKTKAQVTPLQESNKDKEEKSAETKVEDKVVSEERYKELVEKMKKRLADAKKNPVEFRKLLFRKGADPEMLAEGIELAMYNIENGSASFELFAKNMVDIFGDDIRPYCKAFYNGARDMPEMEQYSEILTPYDIVKSIDIANFDKEKVDPVKKVATAIEEKRIERAAELTINNVKSNGLPGRSTAEDGAVGERKRQEVKRNDTERMGGDNSQDIASDQDGSVGVAGVDEKGLKKNSKNNHAKRGESFAPTTDSKRFSANIAAIRKLHELQASGKPATKADMEILRMYSGWGGLGGYFEKYNSEELHTLKELLNDEEFSAAAMSINSAYYTPVSIIETMWDIAGKLGFKGGKILEGSAGIGNILASIPQSMNSVSDITAVEIDPTTGGILKLLYPDADVRIQGFEETAIPNNSIDLAITNVPFVTGLKVYDKVEKDLSRIFTDIHDFCIAKNIRKLKEGGIGIFISSKGTLDKSKKLRDWIVNQGNSDVIGAFRLNNQTFKGTTVTSDIIVVRKRIDGVKSNNAIDVSTTTVTKRSSFTQKEGYPPKDLVTPVAMEYNTYFVEHPENMGGQMKWAFEANDTFRPTSTGCYPVATKSQERALSAWSKTFKEEEGAKTIEEPKQQMGEKAEGVKEGQLVLDSEGKICIVTEGIATPIKDDGKKIKDRPKKECLNKYNDIKDALNAVIAYQQENEDDKGLQPLLDKLNKAYDSFCRIYGRLNKNVAITLLRNDVDFPATAAIEDYTERESVTGKTEIVTSKTDVFNKRIVGFQPAPEPKTIKDAVIVSVNQYRDINVGYIANKLGLPTDVVKKNIIDQGLGFENPTTGTMEVNFRYLSGNVREKLAYAKDNNKDGKYDANIKALEKVIPVDIPVHLLKFSLGSDWIDTKIYEEYAKEKFGTNDLFKLDLIGGAWKLQNDYVRSDERDLLAGVKSEKLGKNVKGHELMVCAMNNNPYIFTKTSKDYFTGKTVTETDREATEAAAVKINSMKEDFIEWIGNYLADNPEIGQSIERKFNDTFNAIAPLEIGEEFLPGHFENSNSDITLYAHQKKAVVKGTTTAIMLAHEVGSGKTFSLITTAMEMRRLGTAKKPMIVVQNSTLDQFTKDAKKLYPGAKILSLADTDRSKEGILSFYAKIKYNDWDMIVIPQSTFERIPDSEERQEAFIQEKIDEKMFVLTQARNQGANDNVINQLKREIDKLEEEKILGVAASTKKTKSKTEEAAKANSKAKAQQQLDRDVAETENFDTLGVDALLIDEAHAYKHLGFATAIQRGVKGVDPSYSKKAASVYLKTRSVFDKVGWKNVVFATGTPISNTAAEIWTFMKYLMPEDVMKQNHIYYFDDFVRNFGAITQELEFQTNGQFKPATRFSNYINAAELVRIWASVCDTVLKKDAEAATGKKLEDKEPKLEGGQAQDVFLPQSPSLIGIMQAVKAKLAEFEKMSGKEKKLNSHIPLTMYSIAKMAAIDPRLVDYTAVDEPLSKTNQAVQAILTDLKETDSYKGTIAVFSDRFSNKDKDKVERFNLFEDMKQKLVNAGIKESEIAIIDSSMSATKKQQIFDKVNTGDIRVIMGSTALLGTGVNIQKRLHLEIHMDAPQRPMDYTQRVGRIKRQGNLHREWDKTIKIIRYGVEDSLDVTSYQILKTKEKFINRIMNGKELMENSMENRTIEEEDEGLFDNPVAMLSGSQYALKKGEAEREVRKYETKEREHRKDQVYIANQTKINNHKIEVNGKKIAEYNHSIEKAKKQFPGGNVTGVTTVEGIKCSNKTAIAEAIKEKINKPLSVLREHARNDYGFTTQDYHYKLNVGGVDIDVKISVTRNNPTFENGTVKLSTTAVYSYTCDILPEDHSRYTAASDGVMGIIDDFAANVVTGRYQQGEIDKLQSQIDEAQKNNAIMAKRYGVPFADKDKLARAKELVAEYTRLMKEDLDAKQKKYEAMQTSQTNIDFNNINEDEDGNVVFRLKNDNQTEEELDNIRFRKVTDRKKLDELNSGKTIKVYRAMQVIDGNLYPPMSAYLNGELREASEYGVWEESEENPELAKDGKFTLEKGADDQGRKSSLRARYNPYFHTSYSPLNDQFSAAQTRSNLVIVEGEVPKSELTSGYKAEGAKNSVGVMSWHSGPISSILAKFGKGRKVVLSRWFKPMRIVPEAEIADIAMNLFDGTSIETLPSNVVTPALRKELEAKGMKFIETDNKGKTANGKSWSKLYNIKSKTASTKKLANDSNIAELDNIRFRKVGEVEIEDIGPAPVYRKGESIKEHVRKVKEWNNKRKEQIKNLREAEKASVASMSGLQALKLGLHDAKVTSEQSVDAILKFVKGMLTKQVKDEVTKGELNRIITQIKAVTKKEDLAPVVDEIYKILQNTWIRIAQQRLKDLVSTKIKGFNQSGIRIAATVGESTRTILGGYKSGVELDETAYNARATELQDIVAADNSVSSEEKMQAFYELSGLEMAHTYKTKLSRIDEDIVSQERAISSYKGKLNGDEKETDKALRANYRKQIKLAEDALVSLKDQKIELIENQNADIAQLIATGRNDYEKFMEDQVKHRREILHMANSDLQTISYGRTQQSVRETRIPKIESTIKFLVPFNTFITMIKKFSPGAIRGEGRMYDHFVRGIQRAEDERYTNFRREVDRLNEKSNEIFGKDFGTIQQRAQDRQLGNATVELWNKNGEKEVYPLSIGTALYLYQCYQQEDGMMKLEAMGINEEKIQELVNELNKIDTGYIRFADWLQQEFYPSLMKRYNKVHRRLFGIPMADIKNYVPIKLDRTGQKVGGDIDVTGGEENKLSSFITGALIERSQNRKMINITDVNAFQVAYEHLQQQEHWFSYAELIRDMNYLLNSQSFKRKVNALPLGKSNYSDFVEVCKVAFGTYNAPSDNLTRSFVNVFMRGVAVSKVSFKLNTAIKQLLSLPVFLAYADESKFVRNMAFCAANPYGTVKWALENLPSLRKRLEERNIGNEKFDFSQERIGRTARKIVDFNSQIGMLPNVAIDVLACSIGARAMYMSRIEEYQKLGLDKGNIKSTRAHDRAVIDAEICFNETQQSSEGLYKSAQQVKRDIVNVAMSVFNNANFLYMRMGIEGMRQILRHGNRNFTERMKEVRMREYTELGFTNKESEDRTKRDMRRDVVRGVFKTTMGLYVAQLCWNLYSPLLMLLGFGSGDEDWKKAALDEAKITAISGPVRGFNFGSNFEQLVRSYISGIKYGSQSIISHPMLADAEKIYENITSEDKDWIVLADMVARLGISSFGVDPYVAAKAMLPVMDAIADGDITKEQVMLDISRMLSMPDSVQKGIVLRRRKGETMDQYMRRYLEYKRFRKYGFSYLLMGRDKSRNVKTQLNQYDKRLIKENWNGIKKEMR